MKHEKLYFKKVCLWEDLILTYKVHFLVFVVHIGAFYFPQGGSLQLEKLNTLHKLFASETSKTRNQIYNLKKKNHPQNSTLSAGNLEYRTEKSPLNAET